MLCIINDSTHFQKIFLRIQTNKKKKNLPFCDHNRKQTSLSVSPQCLYYLFVEVFTDAAKNVLINAIEDLFWRSVHGHLAVTQD